MLKESAYRNDVDFDTFLICRVCCVHAGLDVAWSTAY